MHNYQKSAIPLAEDSWWRTGARLHPSLLDCSKRARLLSHEGSGASATQAMFQADAARALLQATLRWRRASCRRLLLQPLRLPPASPRAAAPSAAPASLNRQQRSLSMEPPAQRIQLPMLQSKVTVPPLSLPRLSCLPSAPLRILAFMHHELL